MTIFSIFFFCSSKSYCSFFKNEFVIKYSELLDTGFNKQIDDLISGFDPSENSFELILDDQPLIFAYQPKLKTISYELEQPLLIGEHTLQFKVKDRAGNQASQKIKFKVY